MAGGLPALNRVKSLELERGLRCERVFLESWGGVFIQAALQGGQSVIGISWGHIVHIQHVSQNHWNVLECFFRLCKPVFIVLWGTALL